MAESQPLARKRSLTWQALAAAPLIAMGDGTSVRELTDVAMARAGGVTTALVEARDIATAGGIIAAGLGVSAVPGFVLPLMPSTGIATRPMTGPSLYRDIAVSPPQALRSRRRRSASWSGCRASFS